MNDRERLFEIFEKANAQSDVRSSSTGLILYSYKIVDSDDVEPLVDYLIANGVTVQKHGRWISEKCNHKPYRIKNPEKWVIYKCSACGYSNGRKQSNYCPNCGAKMDLEDTDG